MRIVENKELPTFAAGIRNGEGGLSKRNDSEEHTLVKPTVLKPAVVPEISLSMFASPEAQKALSFVNGEESEEQINHESDNSKISESDDGRDTDNLEEGEKGIKSRYKWTVVARTVAACPPARARMGRRASLAPDNRCLSPAPPKFDRSRRMSLSPSRYPLLPSRPISPAPPANSEKTSLKSNLEVTNTSSSQELETESQNSSSRPKIDVTGGNPAIARALSRRRFSLPITPSSQLTVPHPPSPSPQRSSPVKSTDSSSPSKVNKRTSVTSTLQANRHKLEVLMRERSKAIANLKIGGSRDSSPSPSSVKSRQNSPRMSPAPIRANHSLARPSLSRRSSITSETGSDASQPDTIETISLLDGGDAARLDAMLGDVIDMGSSPPSDVMSRKSESLSSPRHLSASPLVCGRPVFQRRGSCSVDLGISLSDTASVTSEQESTSSTTNHTDDETRRMSRLRNRRGTICMGSLAAFAASASGESNIRASSSSPRPFYNRNLNQRSNGDIEEEVEEELQERIMQRKSQLLIQAAPGSINMTSAVSSLEARANAKTTNGRLKKIMGNLTKERTTSELLTMKAAMNAGSKRRDLGGIQKSKSLDCD
ncbi:rhoGEF domain-containing protein gxcI [Strongylocentrotus purpuratus]|uniref:Uncharacterized protein n=1 Tax=Strongylocentrotus purpuratus TaxID=7668 RepID=A0A7M7GFG0_STRPU|nr:rhoGEF domain-containing protein gxcI [Strongylocentrotus purpuratus]